MKKLLILTGLFILFLLLMYFIAPSLQRTTETVDEPPHHKPVPEKILDKNKISNSTLKNQEKLSKPTPVTKVSADMALDAMLDSIIDGGSSGSDQYKLVMGLLKTHEQETLEALGRRVYPNDEIDAADPRYDEIAMIARAFSEAYRGQPLDELLVKFEILTKSEMLYNTVIAESFWAAEGWDNANEAYDWVMSNPDEPASLRSGVTIGEKLADFDRDIAWDKSLSLPQGNVRSGALSSVLAVIAASDRDKAEQLIHSQDPSKDLDRSISDLVSNKLRSGDSHESAVNLATSTVDSNYRTATYTELFHHWAQRDASKLKSWLGQNHTHIPEDKMLEIRLVAKQALQAYSNN